MNEQKEKVNTALQRLLTEEVERMGIAMRDFGVRLAYSDAGQRIVDVLVAALNTSHPDWPHRHHAACWLKCDAGRPE